MKKEIIKYLIFLHIMFVLGYFVAFLTILFINGDITKIVALILLMPKVYLIYIIAIALCFIVSYLITKYDLI